MNEAMRATLFLGGTFVAFGITLPYLPLWLEAVRGLTGTQIGFAIFGAALGRLVNGPLLGAWAERHDARTVAITLAGATFTCFTVLSFVHHDWLLILLSFFCITLSWSTFPIIESMLLLLNQRPNMGEGRAIGSASFVGGLCLGGWIKDQFGPEPLVPAIAVVCLFCVGLAFLVPKTSLGAAGGISLPQRLKAGAKLYQRPTLLFLILAAGPIQAAHAFYYGYSAIIWDAQGISGTMISWLWATGVVAEIALLTTTAWWSRFIPPEACIVAGALGSILRWWGLALAPGLLVAFPLQALHSMTFAATYMGAVLIVNRDVAPEDKTVALSLQGALTTGAFTGIAGILAGRIFDIFNVKGYYAMVGLGCVGLAFAIALIWRIATRPKRSEPPKLGL